MQFVKNGPDIPNALVEAHEDGNVVFFCGAGISYAAGLPSFEGLVERIYTDVGTTMSPVELSTFKNQQYDATLDLLERRLGSPKLMREKLAEALRPRLRRRHAMSVHSALLQLGRNRSNELRLVTTNYDSVFDAAARKLKRPHATFEAPTLPVPKRSRWDGLVYLHGKLPPNPTEPNLRQLVATSGDFGRAYLIERWAARFVAELFRNFTVCFVGYSINDPVIRYMMDALAADRMLGESVLPTYSIGGPSSSAEDWEAKGVTPILYDAAPGTDPHSHLRDTLTGWAGMYRDGIQGKERIVTQCAPWGPQASTKQDDYVGRMLWAISTATGGPARAFADLDPPPPLSWLDAFQDARFGHASLRHFGVAPHPTVDAKQRFSLAERPCPYQLAQRMSLFQAPPNRYNWDTVMHHLGRWLARHHGDPNLVLRAARHGLSPQLQQLLQDRVSDGAKGSSGKGAPADEGVLAVWDLVLAGRTRRREEFSDGFGWVRRFEETGYNRRSKREFISLFRPFVELRPAHSFEGIARKGIREHFEWDLELEQEHAYSVYGDIKKSSRAVQRLPELIDDLESLLEDLVDIVRLLNDGGDDAERHMVDLPSIEEHHQNRAFHDWTVLVELLRDAWEQELQVASEQAQRRVERWAASASPIFRRLALYSASRTTVLEGATWVEWLLSNDGQQLWGAPYKREVCRLLVKQGSALDAKQGERLEDALLAGPPSSTYGLEADDPILVQHVKRVVWLRLSKMQASGRPLSQQAKRRLQNISEDHPDWELAANESDEFSFWMGVTGDPEFELLETKESAPRRLSPLIKWLKVPPKDSPFLRSDDWETLCRTRFFLCFSALRALGRRGVWPEGRWATALYAWSGEEQRSRSWTWGRRCIAELPDSVFRKLATPIARWVETSSGNSGTPTSTLIELSRRLLSLETPVSEADSIPLFLAVNHPSGIAAQALLHAWFGTGLQDEQGLASPYQKEFDRIVGGEGAPWDMARTTLATQAVTFYRVDSRWTTRHLLPLFDWKNDKSPSLVWQGFLRSPRLHLPFLEQLKPFLLEATGHANELGDAKRNLVQLLTYAALDYGELFQEGELERAFSELPNEGLEECRRTLSRAIHADGATEQQWVHRIEPFWQAAWPKDAKKTSDGIARAMALFVIEAGPVFGRVMKVIGPWLSPVEHPHCVVRKLRESELCSSTPEPCLELLDRTVTNKMFLDDDLRGCLDDIQGMAPSLAEHPMMKRLRELL